MMPSVAYEPTMIAALWIAWMIPCVAFPFLFPDDRFFVL